MGIPALDCLFVLDGDPMGATTSEGDGDEESGESEEESESAEDEGSAPAGVLRMLRWEMLRWEKSQML